MSSQKPPISARRTVLVSTLVSVSDIVINVVAAVLTGSVVLLAQALQGFADLTSTLMLLIGVQRAGRKPDVKHPMGFGRELFFWVLLSSLFTFVVTASISLYQGARRVLEPTSIDNTQLAFLILGVGLLSNGFSFSLGLMRMKSRAGKGGLLNMLLNSSLVETKMSMLVDLMGTLSASLGLLAIGLFTLTDDSRFDGLGAVAIGTLTAIGALFVINDLRSLIVGRSPSQYTVQRIRRAALRVKDVNEILELHAMLVGSGEVFVIIEVHFADDLTTDQIEKRADQIKASIQKDVSSVIRVQVEPETPDDELTVR